MVNEALFQIQRLFDVGGQRRLLRSVLVRHLTSQWSIGSQPVGHQIERLFANGFTGAGDKQSQTQTPTHPDQMAMIAQRCVGQFTRQRLGIGEPGLTQLMFIETVEVMNVQIFVAFAFGMPKHGNLDALHLIERHSGNSPARGQLIPHLVNRIIPTQRNIYRGLRFGGNPGG